MLTPDSFGHSGAPWAVPGLAGDVEHDALGDDTREARGACEMCCTHEARGACDACDACDIRDPERDEVRSGLAP